MTDLNKLYDQLVELGIATETELNLVTSINGWNEEALNDVIYVRTGYRSLEQLKECEGLED